KCLLKIRQSQAAFHPNATQFALHFGEGIIAFWRESQDQQQHIVCINNILNEPQTLLISRFNLIQGEHWQDLISGETIPTEGGQSITLAPYQSMWIRNA